VTLSDRSPRFIAAVRGLSRDSGLFHRFLASFHVVGLLIELKVGRLSRFQWRTSFAASSTRF
jgi:hypothetical protein